jgi:hypothetical protein
VPNSISSSKTSFFLSPQLYDQLLRMAGEHVS